MTTKDLEREIEIQREIAQDMELHWTERDIAEVKQDILKRWHASQKELEAKLQKQKDFADDYRIERDNKSDFIADLSDKITELEAEIKRLKKSSLTREDAEGIVRKMERRCIDEEIHKNTNKFKWLGKSERRHIDFDNGFQFAINEFKEAFKRKDVKT